MGTIDMRLREYIEGEHYVPMSDLVHLWENHIGITDEELRTRLMEDRLFLATRFTISVATLQKLIRKTLLIKENLNTVREQLFECRDMKNPPKISIVSPVFDGIMKDGTRKRLVLGNGVYRNEPEKIYKFYHMIVVIAAVPGIGLTGGIPRFRIVNAYPCEASREGEVRQ